MKKRTIILWVISPMLLFSAPEMFGQPASCKNSTWGPAFILEQLGYKSDTKEDLLLAIQSSSSVVRHQALELLAERYPDESAGIIKEFVTDPSLEVRWRAARFLNNLGDSGGLEQMRKDYHILTAPHLNNENKAEDPNDLDAASERKRNADFYQAVNVAQIDASVLAKHQVDPIGALCRVGKHEKNRININILVNLSQKNFTPETADLVLSFVLENEHQSGSLKQLFRQMRNRPRRED